MTDLPPPNSPPSQRPPLGFDEFVAVIVAFGAIGAILLVSLGRGPGLKPGEVLPGLAAPEQSDGTALPAPQATVAPSP